MEQGQKSNDLQDSLQAHLNKLIEEERYDELVDKLKEEAERYDEQVEKLKDRPKFFFRLTPAVIPNKKPNKLPKTT